MKSFVENHINGVFWTFFWLFILYFAWCILGFTGYSAYNNSIVSTVGFYAGTIMTVICASVWWSYLLTSLVVNVLDLHVSYGFELSIWFKKAQ